MEVAAQQPATGLDRPTSLKLARALRALCDDHHKRALSRALDDRTGVPAWRASCRGPAPRYGCDTRFASGADKFFPKGGNPKTGYPTSRQQPPSPPETIS